MNEPYSPWHQRNPAGEQPLAARYTGSEPILWNGSMVYPMYTDRIGTEPILLYMTLLSQAPPAGLRGHGLGLSVLQGYIELDGHKLTGVDIWSDALARGVTVELVPTGADAVFSLTPVWVDQTGAHRSWTGNYGMLVEDIPNDIVALWCSLGEGPPNFANLVVGVGIAPVRPGTREPSGQAAADTAEPPESPETAEPLESPAESGERADHTTGESPAVSEWISPEAYADPAPAPAPAETPYAETPYTDSAYADDRLTDTRVPKERQVRRGETAPPTEPTSPFVDENATMTMKYTPPPWGAVSARPESRPASEPAPVRLTALPDSQPGSVWEALPEAARGADDVVAVPEPGRSAESIPPVPIPSLPIPSFDELWESAGSSATEPATEPATESAWASTSAPAADPRQAHDVAWPSSAETAPESEQAWSATTDVAPARPTAQTDEPGAAYRNALYDLGTGMYDRGEDEQACGLWAQAAEAGHAGAAHDLAVLLFRRGEHTAAEGWWRVAAQHGESRSMALLAELLDRRGDSAEAARWRVRAAEADQALHS
ncbi:hypothetical protein [Nocardia shimofusensis]|uniref:hypothetical protein n=1 Tax=Nocardia shimofusensis TaxID=228596 RepID=UPI00082CBCAE|nr:hypothetical protein [Nocardia shimofusensis]